MRIGKAQHYADKAYLALFADPEGCLYCACRRTGTLSVTRPEATACENLLYTRSHLGANFDREAQRLEARIGAAFGPARARLREAVLAGTDGDRRLICRYLLMNAMRNPAFRDMAANRLDRPLDDSHVSEVFVAYATLQIRDRESELCGMNWTLHVPPNGMNWVTTDMPVQVGLEHGRLDNVIAPLTPRLLLWCRRESSFPNNHERIEGPVWTEDLNGRLAKTALRWIYGPSRESIQRAYVAATALHDPSPYDDCAEYFGWKFRSA